MVSFDGGSEHAENKKMRMKVRRKIGRCTLSKITP